MPSGTGYDLSPTFVECAASAAVLHDGPEPVTVPIGGLSKSAAFQKLLDDVKERLTALEVGGMTVTEVKGFGRTGGKTEFYRGSAYVIDFVPKIKIEVVIPAARTEEIIEAIREVAASERIGDGLTHPVLQDLDGMFGIHAAGRIEHQRTWPIASAFQAALHRFNKPDILFHGRLPILIGEPAYDL